MKTQSCSPHRLFLAPEAPDALDVHWFDPQWLTQQGWVSGHSDSSGRNPAWFFNNEGEGYVLRHYWRGGLPGRVFKDGYLYLGEARTRPYRELALMIELWRLGLPIARPIAARLTRKGLHYSADLITARLPNSRDLVSVLSEGPMAEARWRTLGQVLARFHRAGVYHADLNARNILLSRGQFFLIDFDRGELREPAKDWQQANLSRLHRSLLKERGRVAGMRFDEGADWDALMAGYSSEAASAS
ncbi:3-deoxy-D-manno-octulosonic acid kinase [Ferrimonas balearica]|uniref:3-deoxy-D-manno-octulosonic acid kinase n=1 Tax=Ferrimonas balearica TaxID=44012 RepID=UPI001C9A14CE|nr:3-deoxy-D-manno-octulosonic acid kinase [Ferrimonas balearica]MBY5994074.1 3-deoxy-D-manno-octulosonic acid kinase [Ferrimonas balearica]